MSQPVVLPVRFFKAFLEVLNAEIGDETMNLVRAQDELPLDSLDPQAASRLDGFAAAERYAHIQHILRVYYGRGARGILTRIGRLMWERLLENASFPEKAQAQVIRSLPASLRLKPTLELLARFLREKAEGASVHSLDTDLMLADHAAAAALGQTESASICSVTLGLIEEALFWATGHEYDVNEVSCRAAGGDACEFKITVPG